MKTLCGHIMLKNPATLSPNCTFEEALLALRKNSVRYMPVVNDAGEFVGLFSSLTLLNLLLPQALSINMGKKPVDLNFMRTSMEDLVERLGEIGNNPIQEHLITDIPTCYEDSSIMEAIHILHDHHNHVIITPKDSKRLLGVITINGLLDHLTQ
ncbi:MAG: CBS domain-containing protein [Cardiobacteriaceae bacterium]|nr:CBS domain-containing protein [Cardiobacteriaceae bacterium]